MDALTKFISQQEKHNAIIVALTRVTAMLDMAAEIKTKTEHLPIHQRVELNAIIDDIWKPEQVACSAVEEINK